MKTIEIAQTASGQVIGLPLARANRHGLISGSTGGGKTTTMQRMIEEFSRVGVPCFAADIKGDLSGVATEDEESPLAAKMRALGRDFTPARFPVQFWDLFGEHGLPIHTSVQDMGSQLLARMLKLNATQEGALAIAFRKAEDRKAWMLSLDDLRWNLTDMLENREDVCRVYGNITASSITTIQRNLLALEAQGGDRLFGEPPFDILDLIRTDEAGQGVINLLHADQLMEAPKLYAIFLLWLLTGLFRALSEAGDLAKPKLVFFFDEAHLLFTDAPKELVQQIERLVRLVRSKGVGVFFVTQSPADVPDAVLAQLGSRIQHALRAYTPKDQKMVRATAQAFRQNKALKIREEITQLAVGEAIVSVLDEDGVPTMAEKAWIIPPATQVGPISKMERDALNDRTTLRQKYAAGLPGYEQIRAFMNRMRRERGIEEIKYQPGSPSEIDGASFAPTAAEWAAWRSGGQAAKTRGYYLKRIAIWGAVVFAGIQLLGALT